MTCQYLKEPVDRRIFFCGEDDETLKQDAQGGNSCLIPRNIQGHVGQASKYCSLQGVGLDEL